MGSDWLICSFKTLGNVVINGINGINTLPRLSDCLVLNGSLICEELIGNCVWNEEAIS
jgi:hypothetical protein